MRHLLLWTTIVCLALTHPLIASGDDMGEIKAQIPPASAMVEEDYLKLARAEAVPDKSGEDRSLTLTLLELRVRDDETAKEQFRYLVEGYPQPATLGKEACRVAEVRSKRRRHILLGPVTLIHKDRITDFTCEVSGDKATGTVSFKVPELYQGKVDYVATKFGGKRWFITEFTMPAYGIHLVRAHDGQWKVADQ